MFTALKTTFLLCGIFLLVLTASRCSANRVNEGQIKIGYTREQLIAAAGKPDEITEFILPNGPFFGPQEGLSELVAAGTLIEEWQYRSAEQVTYVWFLGKRADPREKWTVIHTAVFPADAVY